MFDNLSARLRLCHRGFCCSCFTTSPHRVSQFFHAWSAGNEYVNLQMGWQGFYSYRHQSTPDGSQLSLQSLTVVCSTRLVARARMGKVLNLTTARRRGMFRSPTL